MSGYDRDKAIKALTELHYDDIIQGYVSLKEMIVWGYRGIDDLSDEEIMMELEDRDVSYLFGENDDI